MQGSWDELTEAEKFKETFRNTVKRQGAEELLKWLEETGFFEAPASTKYHGNYAGGLVEHSNNVYRRLIKLAADEDERIRKMYPSKNTPQYTVETIAIVALLHDICKADHYRLDEDGEYKTTKSFPCGHGEKSVIQIMRYMPLSETEILAIRWHMGAFDEAVKGGSREMNYAYAQCKLAAMLHLADMMATHLDER